MQLEDIISSEMRQAQEDKVLHDLTYKLNLKKIDLIEVENRMVVIRSLRRKSVWVVMTEGWSVGTKYS